jgi:hypothetical protein
MIVRYQQTVFISYGALPMLPPFEITALAGRLECQNQLLQLVSLSIEFFYLSIEHFKGLDIFHLQFSSTVNGRLNRCSHLFTALSLSDAETAHLKPGHKLSSEARYIGCRRSYDFLSQKC